MSCITASNNCFRQSFYDPDVDWEERWFVRSLEHDLTEQYSRYKGMSANYCSVCQIFCSDFDRVIDVVDSDLVIIRCQACDLKSLSYCAKCRIRFPHKHCQDRGCMANPHHVGRDDLLICERCNGCHGVSLTFCQSCKKCHDESYRHCSARKEGESVDTMIREMDKKKENEKQKDTKNKNKVKTKNKNKRN
jgi:hypothetical protein